MPVDQATRTKIAALNLPAITFNVVRKANDTWQAALAGCKRIGRTRAGLPAFGTLGDARPALHARAAHDWFDTCQPHMSAPTPMDAALQPCSPLAAQMATLLCLRCRPLMPRNAHTPIRPLYLQSDPCGGGTGYDTCKDYAAAYYTNVTLITSSERSGV